MSRDLVIKQWKQKHYPGRPPLTLTGELKSKLTVYFHGESSAEVYVQEGLHQKIPGFPWKAMEEPRDYSAIVQGLESGSRAKDKPRQIFGINEREIETVFEKFIRAVEAEL